MIAGIGRQRLRKIAVDEQGSMDPIALKQSIDTDRANGLIPFFVCATIGTTSTLAIDPIEDLGPICKRDRIWLHVDGAMAGTASLCPEYREIHRGLDFADSYCFNPHKWMFTNFDCDCFFVADRFELISSLSVLPEYLRNRASEQGEVIDYRDWQIPLGRRFRALKLWFVLRHYGINGLQFHIRQHIQWAESLAQKITEHPEFDLLVPQKLNLLCFAHQRGDEFSQQLLENINKSGALFATHTRIAGRYAIRFCIGQTHTQWHHVEAAWQTICRLSIEIEDAN